MIFPQIKINLKKIKENAKRILDLCQQSGIESVFLVTKVLAGDKRIINEIAGLGFTHLADSRIENLKIYSDLNLPKVLLRLPMISEIEAVIKYANLSLNSEIEVIRLLNAEAKKQNKIHEIILMFDLGDLREGIFYQDEYLKTVAEILNLSNLRLTGIGTNLTCYGGIIPTKENLSELIKIKKEIETRFQIELSLISGGNSSSLHLLPNLPPGINNLRIGEALFLGRETAYGKNLPGMHPDCFELVAELIEVKTKPSYPLGIMGMDSFGNVPKIEDRGLMKRGILAIGKQDVALEDLMPLDENVEILGGSSDHLLVQLNGNFLPGDKLRFAVNYPGLLRLMTSKYVKKEYWNKS
ncbi:MAG TPA: alanine/ornithine racemase family PLP-dependent enzyme [Acholeplasmataceae bacterium]|jgi:predicted amino acid racemase|nr:alanine/ornithine racemase family PLP-dependent enzyme [Acholeplasmataceae bacterium]